MNGGGPGWRHVLGFVRRELRAGFGPFRVFLACLIIGVAALAAVGTLSASIEAGMRRDGRVILGGDVSLDLAQRPASAAEEAWMRAQGDVSASITMRSMARANGGSTLVELKSIDERYPLYGRLQVESPNREAEIRRPQDLLAPVGGLYGALAERQLLTRLGIDMGDEIAVGQVRLQIRGIILREPDRASAGLGLGPRLLISPAALAASTLVQPGSLMHRLYRIKLPPGTDPAAFRQAAERAFPDAGWRIRDRDNGAPGLSQFVERLRLFLSLVGLTALLISGVGIANAVGAYMAMKRPAIATLKSLGAGSGTIFTIYLLQILTLAAIATVAGLLLGAVLPWAAISLMGGALPVPIAIGLFPAPLVLAAAFGMLTALAFSLWPLALARTTSPAGLFRALVSDEGKRPQWPFLAVILLCLAAVAALALFSSDEPRFVLWFLFGAMALFALLRLAAWAVMRVAGRVRISGHPLLRLAVANLHRPGAATASIVLSLGLGLSLLVAIVSVEGNLRRQITDQLPEDAPAFFFIDIQKNQIGPFRKLASATEGVEDIEDVPSLRGRIVSLKGVPVQKAEIAPHARWVLRGDRALTYADAPPANNRIVAGSWWPADYAGPPLVSFEAEAAAGLGLAVGDEIGVNILGRTITARIANLREVDWGSMALNFVMIFSPDTLRAAPHGYIATARADGAGERALYERITQRFANITVIRLKETLQEVNRLLNRILIAISGSAGLAVFSGLLVVGGALAAGARRRQYDAAILKVLGAGRREILQGFLLEYALLGLIAGTVAAFGGSAIAFAIVTGLMRLNWQADVPIIAATVLFGVVVTVLLGLAGTWRGLGRAVWQRLRSERT